MSTQTNLPAIRRPIRAPERSRILSLPVGAKARSWLFLSAALVLLGGKYEFAGARGYLALREKQREYAAAIQNLHRLEEENKRLHDAVDRLKSDPESIEQIAREELHLAKPGEMVFTYPATPSVAKSDQTLPQPLDRQQHYAQR